MAMRRRSSPVVGVGVGIVGIDLLLLKRSAISYFLYAVVLCLCAVSPCVLGASASAAVLSRVPPSSPSFDYDGRWLADIRSSDSGSEERYLADWPCTAVRFAVRVRNVRPQRFFIAIAIAIAIAIVIVIVCFFSRGANSLGRRAPAQEG